MADSSTYLDSEGHYLLGAAALNAGGYGVSYRNGVINVDHLVADSAGAVGEGGFVSTFVQVHQTGADSDFNFYRTGGSRSFGQGLIMALDSDARNAVGDGGGTGGLTQYWIG